MAVASGHRRSLLATSPVDVVSSDRHTVKPWLDARLGLSPPAPDLAKEGFVACRRQGRGHRRPAGAGVGLPPQRASDHAGRAAAEWRRHRPRRSCRRAASRWSNGATAPSPIGRSPTSSGPSSTISSRAFAAPSRRPDISSRRVTGRVAENAPNKNLQTVGNKAGQAAVLPIRGGAACHLSPRGNRRSQLERSPCST